MRRGAHGRGMRVLGSCLCPSARCVVAPMCDEGPDTCTLASYNIVSVASHRGTNIHLRISRNQP